MLSKNHILIAGDPSAWDAETVSRVEAGEDLASVQVDQFNRGRLSAQLYLGANGWIVISASNLQKPAIIYNSTDTWGRKEVAIAYGKKWASLDPKNREFFMRKDDERN